VFGWRRVLKPFAQLGLLLVVGRRVPSDVGAVTVEKVRDDDLVRMVLVGGGENVGALQGLREEAENVVDGEDGGVRVGRASDVWVERSVSQSGPSAG